MKLILHSIWAAFLSLNVAHSNAEDVLPSESTQGPSLTEQIRNELLRARETAWRSFFQNDLAAVERILAPELIAIQEEGERWENRERLLKMATAIAKSGVQLTRLEFPRTDIQLFGDTAILYYTYIMEQRVGQRSALHAGRGTEVFVRRNGQWVDVGWHLDHGPFKRQDGQWIRLGVLPAESSAAPTSPHN